MSENVLPMTFTRSFMVSCLIFKSLSHSEFIFAHGIRVCSNFIDLHATVQLSQHHLLRSSSFTFNVIIDIVGFMSAILLFVFYTSYIFPPRFPSLLPSFVIGRYFLVYDFDSLLISFPIYF